MPEVSKAVTTAERRAPLVAGPSKVQAIVPKDVEQVFRLATAIARADMAPKGYERNQEKIAVAIIHGMEVGFTPMAALQSIAVINGTPTVWGDGALGLVRSSGLLEDFEERLEGEGDKRVAICRVQRKGQKTPIERRFSVADAKEADLWTKKGPWQEYRQRMLQMRARSWALRDGFADVLRGLGIAEEVRDMGELVDAGDGTYAPPPPRPSRNDHERQAEEMDEQFAATVGPANPDPTPASSTGGEETAGAGDGTTGQADMLGAHEGELEGLIEKFGGQSNLEGLETMWAENNELINACTEDQYKRINDAYEARRQELRT